MGRALRRRESVLMRFCAVKMVYVARRGRREESNQYSWTKKNPGNPGEKDVSTSDNRGHGGGRKMEKGVKWR